MDTKTIIYVVVALLVAVGGYFGWMAKKMSNAVAGVNRVRPKLIRYYDGAVIAEKAEAVRSDAEKTLLNQLSEGNLNWGKGLLRHTLEKGIDIEEESLGNAIHWAAGEYKVDKNKLAAKFGR